MASRMEHVIEVAVPAERAFGFVTTARNWERFHPMTVGVSGDVEHSAVRGDEIVERATATPGRLVWRVLEHRPPERWTILGWIQIGRLWRREVATLTYTFAPARSGGTTVVTREMTYEPGLLAPLVALIRSRTEEQCAEALRRLKGELESGRDQSGSLA